MSTATEPDDDVVADLRRRYDELTISQKRIAEAIVEDPEFVAFATVDKLGARLNVSPSTIVRFAYRIGLDGYQDLQERVRQRVRLQMRSNVDIQGTDGLLRHLGDGPFGDSIRRDLDNLYRTAADATTETLDAAVEAIQSARHIYVAGHVASDSLAQFAALALGRLHGNAFLLRNDGNLAPMLYEVTADDVFLVLSFPPYASQSLAIVKEAEKKGARVIAVTDSVISPIGQRASLVLTAHVSGVSIQNSLVAPLMLLNAVINGVAAGSENARKRHKEIMRTMGGWDWFVLKDDGA